MKEYISKDALDETRQDFIDTVYSQLSNEPDNFKANNIIDAYDLSIDNLTTVTKADICREIIANVENEVTATQVDYKEALYRILEYLETGRWDYTILAEMEEEG